MALLTKLSFQGKVEMLLRRQSRDQGFEKQHCDRLSLLLSGPEGDCHTGLTRLSDSRTLLTYKRNTVIRNVRQMTIISQEEMEDVARAMNLPEMNATWLGANLVTSGIPDLTLIPPSTRLQFPSGATLVVDMENLPCRQVADVIARDHPEQGLNFVKAATHKRGVTAWVECEGDVKMGDAITIFISPQRIYNFA
ncbi:MAG: MOSC domain-containing protein [Alphaproteobacteria bacterium]|nr:MOSC domain-containing protein [Alphaproteobacteria bacterium]